MKHPLRKALSTALALLCAVPAWAGDRSRVTVGYLNQANIASYMLSRATRVASEVFERAGIILEWEVECPGRPVCDTALTDPAHTSEIHVVFLLSTDPSHPCPLRCSSCALRALDGSGGTVFVLYDRAKEEAELIRRSVLVTDSESATVLILGYFLAHEMGHLLLPDGRHAIAGIMKARLNRTDWRFASLGTLRFLPGQAAAMRRRVLSQVASGVDNPMP